MPLILRELAKAFVGFGGGNVCKEMNVSTGRWGCGVFKGDS